MKIMYILNLLNTTSEPVNRETGYTSSITLEDSIGNENQKCFEGEVLWLEKIVGDKEEAMIFDSLVQGL